MAESKEWAAFKRAYKKSLDKVGLKVKVKKSGFTKLVKKR